MRKNMSVLFAMLSLVVFNVSAHAQAHNNTEAVQALHAAMAVFVDSNYQHLDLLYRFSYVDQPDAIQDSLHAEYKTWKNSRW